MRKAAVLAKKLPSVPFITIRTRWTSVRTQELSCSKRASSMLHEARETGQAKNTAGRAWALSRRGEHDTSLCAAHRAASVREEQREVAWKHGFAKKRSVESHRPWRQGRCRPPLVPLFVSAGVSLRADEAPPAPPPDQEHANSQPIQPFLQKSRTATVPKVFRIGLYGVVEADLELFCNSWSAGFLGERL